MNRVVVTGLGCLVPCGDNVDFAFNSVLNFNSWIKENDKFDISTYKSKICSAVDITDELLDKYEFLVSKKEYNRIDAFEYVAIVAAYNALVDCGLYKNDQIDKTKIGTFIASGIGGIKSVQENAKNLFEKGNRRISPFFLPSHLINMCAGNVALKFGLSGASMSIVSACASSSNAIGEAYNYIRNGKLTGCLAGGSEMAICELGFGGFDNMNALSSKYNDTPDKASRALDKDRDGFVMGEGACILMLEDLESAKKRGAKIYCEIVGYGASCDAYHITSPRTDGVGASNAMKLAIDDANIKPQNIDYINLHGTSTQLGDVAEITAIKNTFENYANTVNISSTKSITGHLLGASGALEAMFCAKSLEKQILIPSANIYNIDEKCADMNIVKQQKKHNINYILSNSFGFGGANSCLIFKKYE